MPEIATDLGYHVYDDQLRSYNLTTMRSLYKKSIEFIERAENLKNLTKNDSDHLNLQLLLYGVQTYVNGYKYKGYLFPLSKRYGPQLQLKILVKNMKFENEADYRKLLSRYSSFPKQVDEIISLMKLGIEEGYTLHESSMKGIDKQFEALQVPYEDSDFYKPFKANVSSALQMEARGIIETELLPAFQRLWEFIQKDYMLALRKDIASTSLPNGKAFYQQCLRYYTSTDLTPEEIHEKGLQEVKRIEAEMQKIVEDLGYNLTVKEFSDKLRQDPASYYSRPEDELANYREIINRVIPHLPRLFKTVPKLNLLVEAISPLEGNRGAYYIAGTSDGRAGIFFVNVGKKLQPKYEIITLTLHEGYPGHHLQISHVLEKPGLPEFRKIMKSCYPLTIVPSCFGQNIVFREGWALYAETLGFELQLYEDMIARYGHYSKEIFRACRLVVDTGIHAMNWTKEQAVQYMAEHSASAVPKIKAEIDRYITLPGQACAYKIGELKIKELRKKAKQKLGGLFDIRNFHEVVLNCDGPLSILEQCVDRYLHK